MVPMLVLMALLPGYGLEALGSSRGGDVEKQIEEALREFRQAQDPREAYEALQMFFARAETGYLRKLQTNDFEGLALLGAWGQVRQSVPVEMQLDAIEVDDRLLHRFLGFVEGRLSVELPDCWERGVLGAYAWKRDVIVFRIPKDCRYQKDRKHGFWLAPGTSLQRHGEHMVVQVGEESVAIPAVVLEQAAPRSTPSVSAFLGRQRCYLAIHSQIVGPYSLFCIERKSGSVLWKTTVWTEGGLIAVGAEPGPHCVTIIEQEGRVLVFGLGGLYSGIEAFSVEDGRNLFRFSAAH